MTRAVCRVFLGVALLAQGCAGLERSVVSTPTIAPGAAAAMSSSGVMELPGIRIGLAAYNERSSVALIGPAIGVPLPVIPLPVPERPPQPEFWIAVHLDPVGEEFAFDPGRATLTLPGAAGVQPSSFEGPAASWLEPGPIACLASLRSARAPSGPVSVAERQCFVLRFDVPEPGVDQPFTLSIDGLSRAGQPVTVPVVSFTKGARWQFGVAP